MATIKRFLELYDENRVICNSDCLNYTCPFYSDKVYGSKNICKEVKDKEPEVICINLSLDCAEYVDKVKKKTT